MVRTTGLMSTLSLMYLMEGDEGTYTCIVITSNGGSGLGTVEIMTLAGKPLSIPKQPNCKKRCGPCKKKQHEKSCEIKGGSPEVAVVV